LGFLLYIYRRISFHFSSFFVPHSIKGRAGIGFLNGGKTIWTESSALYSMKKERCYPLFLLGVI
jgi:hypothetical protein